MTKSSKPVRVHVHWLVKAIMVLGIVYFPFKAYEYWQHGMLVMSITHVVLIFLGVWVFFLADSKIDVDQNEIRLTAPHGLYRMKWSEVKFVEKKGQVTSFFGEDKAIVYNLFLAGKGRREFQRFTTNMIREWKTPHGRPPGVTYIQIQKMMTNAKVRGWKLF